MSDGRKRKSGAEYKRLREEKAEKEAAVIKKIPKLQSFFVSKIPVSDVIPESEKVGNDLNPNVVQQDSLSNTAGSDILDPISTDTQNTYISPVEKDVGSSVCAATESNLTDLSQSPSQNFEIISDDPAKWVGIEINRLQEHFIKYGFKQNISELHDFSKSKRSYEGQNRFFSYSLLFRENKKNGEIFKRHWLIYSASTGSIFCGSCRLFRTYRHDSALSSDTGYSDWKNAASILQQHETSKEHNKCLMDMKERSKQLGTMNHHLVVQMNDEIRYWKDVLHRIIAVVKTLASRGHAFRGTNALLNSPKNGNFLMCIELLAQFDPFLAEHLKMHGNKGSGHVSYLSQTTYEEFIALMADKVKKFIIDDCKKNKYFSIILDSTPDVSHTDQLSLIIRYVNEHGKPVERFLTFIDNTGHKSDEIVDATMKALQTFKLSIEDCRGQSYDNAANMSGLYNGVQAKINELNRQAEYVPCAAHSLNLVGTCAAECCLEGCKFFNLLQELYNFFTASTQRWEVLQSNCKKMPGSSTRSAVKDLSKTRWSAREEACKGLTKSYHAIYESLVFYENDKNQKQITRSEAAGIRFQLDRFETSFMISFWGLILNRINKVSKTLQNEEINILKVIELYDSLINLVKGTREKFEQHEKDALNFSVFHEEPNYEEKQRRKKRRLHSDENRTNETTHNPRDDFRINTFLVILDTLLAELIKRKQSYEKFGEKFSFLLKLSNEKLAIEEIRKNVNFLVGCYPQDLEKNLTEECIHMNEHLVGNEKQFNDLLSFYEWFSSLELHSEFPNLSVVLRISLCIPCTNASAERSFSALKRIKNYLRSTMAQERLIALAILNIESDITIALDYDDIINEFSAAKSRKKSF